MMRVSPLNEEDTQISTRERANIWPLYYHNGQSHSLIWPLIDWDNQGVAVRPLYNKEGAEHAILFPLCGWNTEVGDGWFLTSYRKPGTHGVFPIYRHNPDGFSHYGLYWTKEPNWGLFPLYATKERGHQILNLSWTKNPDRSTFDFWPLYSKSPERTNLRFLYNRQEGEDYLQYSLLMSVLAHYEQRGEVRKSYVFPFWYDSHYKNADTRVIFPFYWTDQSNGDKHTVFLPLLYTFENSQQFDYYTPLCFRRGPEKQQTFGVLPLYYSGQRDAKTFSMFLPLYYKQNRGDDEKMLVTPLGGYGAAQDGSFAFRNILGPVYVDYQRADYQYRSLFWPLIRFEQESDQKHTFNAFPVYAQVKKDDETDHRLLLNLANANQQEDKWSWRVWPLVSRNTQARRPDFLYDFSLTGVSKVGKAWEGWMWPFYGGKSDENMGDHAALFYMLRNRWEVKGGETIRNYQAWPLFTWSESRRNEGFWGSIGGIYKGWNYRDERRNGWSILGELFIENSNYYNRDAAKPSRRTEVLMVSTYQDDQLSDHVIPSPNNDPERELAAKRRFNLLWYNYGVYDMVFWKEGVLTDEEMELIDEWSSDCGRFYYESCSSKISSYQKRTLYMPNPKFRDWSEEKLNKGMYDLLKAKGMEPTGKTTVAIRESVRQFTRENREIKSEKSTEFWPFYEHHRNEIGHDKTVLFGLYRSKRYEDKSRSSVLKYLYRTENDGKTKRRDFFPFISWDSGEEAGHSFLWRVWSFRKGNENNYGHFLFIPWGKHPAG